MTRTGTSEELINDPSACWRGLGVLASAMLLGMTTWFSATAVVPQLTAMWSASAAEAAWLTIAVQLGFVIGALGSAGTNLVDRLPPRRLMLYGATGAALTNALLLVVPTIGTAIALRGLTGLCLAGVYPPAMKAMATWFHAKRGTALGVMVGALTLGSSGPHVVNAFGGLHWETVIVTTSVLTVLGGVTAEFIGADGPYSFPKGQFDLRQTWQAFTNRRVLLPCLGYFGHMWELYAMWAWFGVFIHDTMNAHQVTDAGFWSALSTFAVIAVGALGCWLGGVLGDRWGRSRSTIVAMVISGACAATIGFTQMMPLPIVLAIAVIWGFWVVADSAQFSTLVTELGEPRYVGTALTLQLAIGFVLTIPTIWLIPLIEASSGWGYAFALLAIGPVLGVTAMLRLQRVDRDV